MTIPSSQNRGNTIRDPQAIFKLCYRASMHTSVFAHSVMLLLAATSAALGWHMAHNPTQAFRFFTFGIEPMFGKKFFVMFCRVSGWLFFAGMSAGGVLYIVLIISDVAHRS